MEYGYGIHPRGLVSGAYVARFSDLDAAKAQARDLAEKNHVEVIVFQIVGSFSTVVEWHAA